MVSSLAFLAERCSFESILLWIVCHDAQLNCGSIQLLCTSGLVSWEGIEDGLGKVIAGIYPTRVPYDTKKVGRPTLTLNPAKIIKI